MWRCGDSRIASKIGFSVPELPVRIHLTKKKRRDVSKIEKRLRWSQQAVQMEMDL
jgi:hypothetical protein